MNLFKVTQLDSDLNPVMIWSQSEFFLGVSAYDNTQK